jgi:hydrogenase/urease accessory protein HupE
MGAITLTERGPRILRRGQPARLAPRGAVAVVLALCASARVLAHDPGLSALDLRVGHHEVGAVLSLAATDADSVGGPEAVGQLALELIQIRLDDRPVAGSMESISTDSTGGVHARLVFRGAAGSRLVVRSELVGRFARGHRELVSIRAKDGRLLVERMLDAHSNEALANVSEPTGSAGDAVVRFCALGIRHILTGYDHLLFLAGLLVVVRRWRDVLQTVTAFTVAHSVTLALATTGVVNVPSRIVEVLIAASIVYVGLENLVRSVPCSRWKLTFGFGLIHGLGFATALRELGIGTDGIPVALPLMSFNVGVEIGQVAVATVLVPLFWKLYAQPGPRLSLASAWSLLVVVAGSYWLLERIV